MTCHIIGIDCATQDRRVGLALGSVEEDRLTILDARIKVEEPVSVIGEWLEDEKRNVRLLTLDAPLGWPLKMGEMLSSHQAGEPLEEEPGDFFHRETDDFVWNTLKKRPLEVGASFIARTALAALRLLKNIRLKTQRAIPLAWKQGKWPAEMSAIEVYPGATILSHRILLVGEKYKKQAEREGRELLISRLKARGVQGIEGNLQKQLEASSDTLDAVLCVLAGMDFVQGRCYPPVSLERAKREGWIWFPVKDSKTE